MNMYSLPTSVLIDDVECKINSDYREIINIMLLLNDPDLLDEEKILLALDLFYCDLYTITNLDKAIECMFDFINAGDSDSSTNSKPLYDWEQDFKIIIAPINTIIGKDIRGLEYLHWWTFLSAFMEIGEGTFNTFVGIRDKLNKGKKLEKYEERIYNDNRDRIILKKRVDSTTQSLIDEIIGKGV